PWSWFFGVVFPLMAVLGNLLSDGAFRPDAKDCQSATWSVGYAPQAQRWLYPVIGWSIAAYWAWASGKRGSWVRVGLWGGYLVAIAFSVLYAPLFPRAFVLFLVVIGLLLLAPFTSVFAYARAGLLYEQARGPEHGKAAMAGFTSLWTLLAAGGAWKTVETMQDLYAALPPTVPRGGCYLVTVAARGDRRVTGAERVTLRDGREMLVSRQLRRFKAFEMVLAALAPRLHRAVR